MYKIYYITKIHFDSSRTHVYNIAHTCEALNDQENVSISLISIDKLKDKKQFFDYHGISHPFEILGLDVPFVVESGRLRYALWLLKINVSLGWFLFKRRKNYDVLYVRDEGLVLAALFARLLGRPFFFESHSVLVGRHRQLLNIAMVRFSKGLIAINKQLQKYYCKWQKDSMVAYCGSEESFWIDYAKTKESSRAELKLPKDAFIVGYTGVLGENPNGDVYELDDVVRGLNELSKEVIFVMVGERDTDAQWLRNIAQQESVLERCLIFPWQERHVAAQYLRSFDVIVIPKRHKDLAGDSPLKMFSAMSAERPIVGGQTRAVTEILKHGHNALIVDRNAPSSWASAIQELYEDKSYGTLLAKQALADSKNYTWESRGGKIAAFIKEELESR